MLRKLVPSRVITVGITTEVNENISPLLSGSQITSKQIRKSLPLHPPMLRPVFKNEEHFWSSKKRKDMTELDKVPGGAAIMIKDFLCMRRCKVVEVSSAQKNCALEMEDNHRSHKITVKINKWRENE